VAFKELTETLEILSATHEQWFHSVMTSRIYSNPETLTLSYEL